MIKTNFHSFYNIKRMMDKKLERKVFIFTILLVIGMFVTMALYVYAGKQQNLPTRELGAVNVKKTLGVNGKFYQQTDIIPIVGGETMVSFDGGGKIYTIDPGSNTSITLPRVSVLDGLKSFNPGRMVEFYLVNESGSNTVTLAIDSDDQTRMSFVYTPTARGQGVTSIMIRKTSGNDYQVIVG